MKASFIMFYSFMLIIFAILGQRTSSEEPEVRLGQRKLQNDNYISVKYSESSSYQAFFVQTQYEQEISHMLYEEKSYKINDTFDIEKDKTLDIYFSYPINSLKEIFVLLDKNSKPNNIYWVDLSNFDSSSLENVESMFSECLFLNEINFKNFNISKVTNMANMFYGCDALESVDLSEFGTSKVINMANMFYNCRAIKSLDLSGFDTSNVENMEAMFLECNN